MFVLPYWLLVTFIPFWLQFIHCCGRAISLLQFPDYTRVYTWLRHLPHYHHTCLPDLPHLVLAAILLFAGCAVLLPVTRTTARFVSVSAAAAAVLSRVHASHRRAYSSACLPPASSGSPPLPLPCAYHVLHLLAHAHTLLALDLLVRLPGGSPQLPAVYYCRARCRQFCYRFNARAHFLWFATAHHAGILRFCWMGRSG